MTDLQVLLASKGCCAKWIDEYTICCLDHGHDGYCGVKPE